MTKDLCKSCRFANPDDRAKRIITGRGEIRCRHDKTLIRTSTSMQNIVKCVYFMCDGCPYLERVNGQQGCGMFAEVLALLDELEAARATLAAIDKYVRELKEAVGP